MRVAAAWMLVALLFSTAAPLALRIDASCCCKSQRGATCPMKRKAASGCDKTSAMSCGMQSRESSAAIITVAGDHQPAILVAVLAPSTLTADGSWNRHDLSVVARHLQPPDAPPPERA
jgi:hypothetical protein